MNRKKTWFFKRQEKFGDGLQKKLVKSISTTIEMISNIFSQQLTLTFYFEAKG